VSNLRADVIYNNFGPGDTYFGSNYTIAGPLSVQGEIVDSADSFIAPGPVGTSYTLTKIELAVALIEGKNLLSVALMSDSNGLPGNVIESFQFTNAMSKITSNPTSRPLEADSLLHPELQAGTRYWLAALGTADLLAAWYTNDTGASRLGAYIGNVVAWHRSPDPQMAAAFRIEGDAITSPEPSSLVVTGIGGLLFLGYAWRRRKAKFATFDPSLAQ
jgi:hypothetical protein